MPLLEDIPALVALASITLLAGLIYGFAGFGAMLVFMPLAVTILDPLVAVAAASVTAIASLITVVPGAWREGDRKAAGAMLVASWVCAPFGLWVLASVDIAVARWMVSIVVLGSLVLLLTGWRYHSKPGWPAWIAVGGAVGVLGGSTGLNGPALVLFQLGGQDSVARSRANTILVLTLGSIGWLPIMALQGYLTREAILLGLVLLPIYALGSWAGRRLFAPEREALYRRVAYVLIGTAGVAGLPIWG